MFPLIEWSGALLELAIRCAPYADDGWFGHRRGCKCANRALTQGYAFSTCEECTTRVHNCRNLLSLHQTMFKVRHFVVPPDKSRCHLNRAEDFGSAAVENEFTVG
jgi:hypothetical protein